MTMFPSIGISGTGLNVDEAWIDTIGGNVANSEDAVSPGAPVYRAQYLDVEAQPQSVLPTSGDLGAGVEVKSVELGSAKGVLVEDPTNPLAKNGEVEMPDVSVSHELVSLVEAETSYQANANVMQHATNAYEAVLGIKVTS
ncbi:MAG TPA: flagellar basal body rod C-terminal domain-containing protein [Acidimicrobiales bacterium]|nr:flagellar basal body rod C-terminal domain-containing protein [Acidimicrobiales bacterium]